MSDQDKAIIGIESCGCITFAEVVTDRKRSKAMERETDRALMYIVRTGGQVLRTTVAEARAMPYFLEGECPHDPKGWVSHQ